MKYRFVLPYCLSPGAPLREAVFDCETPAESDLGDAGEAAQEFVDRAIRCARYIVRSLERGPVQPEAVEAGEEPGELDDE